MKTLGFVCLAFASSVFAHPLRAHADDAPSALRQADGGVKLDWKNWAGGAPVNVWRATSPYARGKALTLISKRDNDGGELVKAVAGERSYFLLKSAKGKAYWVAERVLTLTGGQNFRDIGGYSAASGKTVRWGQVYRSASMAGHTGDDQALLKRIGISSIIDLRSTSERKGDSNPWMAGSGLGYWARDYDLSGGNLGGLASMDRTKITPDFLRAMMIKGYQGFPKEQASSYREMFARLVGDPAPLALNCTAGKDRTGLGTALILTALGVPYETVKADFLISNTALDVTKPGADRMLKAVGAAFPPDVAAPLIGVEGAYLDAAFAKIKADYGSVETYLEKELGVGPKQLKALRKRLLI